MWNLRTNSPLFFPVLVLALLFSLTAAQASAGAGSPSRSIHGWAHCDGKTDDNAGVAAAFAAAQNGAFTLVVDCPVFIHVGTDIRRPIYIDNGITVQFANNGLITVDNADIPAFVIANSENIHLLGWRVEYAGGLPVARNWTGYYDNGTFKPGKWPSTQFSDDALTSWLRTHRNINLGQPGPWMGLTNTAAIFYIVGTSRNIEVRDLKLFVPPNAKGSQFIPMAFSMTGTWKSNQTAVILKKTPITAEQFGVPNNLTFSDIDLDGYYMGWQGSVQNGVFEHIRAHRYGDLQDDEGGNTGGVGKWFAPPHLFYLNYGLNQPGLENRNIRISDVIDYGNRVGVARDRGGADPGSGFANSLKLGAFDSEVDGYKSYRPDGLFDLLSSTNLKISNVDATYDSSFLNGLYPAIRFPQAPYHNVTLENVQIVDKAATTKNGPIWGFYDPSSTDITFTNVKVILHQWGKPAPGPNPLKSLCPPFPQKGNKIDVQYIVSGQKQECH
jgi:hypothetical protein